MFLDCATHPGKDWYRVLVLGIVISILALVIVLVVPQPGSDTLCGDSNECTFNTAKDGFCERRFFDQSRPCSTCFAADTGHCDGSGACAGDPADCLGYCNVGEPADTDGAACDSTFTWDAGWEMDANLLSTQTWCFADRCTAIAAFRVANTVNPNFYPTSVVQCKDLMDATWWAANGTCIDVERYLAGSEPGGTVDVHYCYYHWRCGVFNETWLAAWEDL
jgi:hypothetical protein